jgi:hypothetical protein
MTDYDRKTLRCYCCGKESEQTVLMSTNSRGSPDLDQRAAGMARHTIHSWLQECPCCGYVAPDIAEGDERALSFAETTEFRALSSLPSSVPEQRRFLLRAAFHASCGDRRAAFLATLHAAWIADDRKQPSEAAVLRLRAAAHLASGPIKSIDTRLLLLDVLRRASSWEAADALASELTGEQLEYPFAAIVSFHRDKIAARDDGCYTIAEALTDKPKPVTSEESERIKALARHIKIVPSTRRT